MAGDAYDDLDLVFCNELGGTIHPQRLTEGFVRLRTAAGIPTSSVHVLRHTHITHLLTEGVPLHVVAGRGGDDPKTVLDTYADLLPHSDAQAAVLAAQLVEPAPSRFPWPTLAKSNAESTQSTPQSQARPGRARTAGSRRRTPRTPSRR